MVGWAGSAAQLVQSSWFRNTEVQPNYLDPGNMRMREPGPRRDVNYEGKSIGQTYPIEPGDGVGRRPARGRPQADREKIDKGVGKNTGWDNDVHTNTSQQGTNMSGLLNPFDHLRGSQCHYTAGSTLPDPIRLFNPRICQT